MELQIGLNAKQTCGLDGWLDDGAAYILLRQIAVTRYLMVTYPEAVHLPETPFDFLFHRLGFPEKPFVDRSFFH